jgi:hypothetical protein
MSEVAAIRHGRERREGDEMTDANLIKSSEPLAGEPLVAAGIFKLHEDVAALFAGGLVGAAMPSIGHGASSGTESDMGADAARALVARKKGLTPEMIVAVSERYVHVLSLPSTAGTGIDALASVGLAQPGAELMRFERETAQISVKIHLRKVYLKLSDQDHSLGLVSARTESVGGGKEVAEALKS